MILHKARADFLELAAETNNSNSLRAFKTITVGNSPQVKTCSRPFEQRHGQIQISLQ